MRAPGTGRTIGGRGMPVDAARVDRQRLVVGRAHRRSGTARRACSRCAITPWPAWGTTDVARLGAQRRRPRARRAAAASPGRCRRTAPAWPRAPAAACRRPPARRRAASGAQTSRYRAGESCHRSQRPARSVDCARRGMSSAQTTEKCMPGGHVACRAARHRLRQRRARPSKRPCVGVADRRGQRRRQRRHVQRRREPGPAACRASASAARSAGHRVRAARPRAAARPAAPASVRAGRGSRAAQPGSSAAGSKQGVERGLVVGRERGRQHHVGRRHAVDHGAPHALAGTGAGIRAPRGCRTSHRRG